MIEIETTNIRDFMRAIQPTEAHFAGPPVAFRGQADSAWGLVPTMWRVKSWEALGGAVRHGLRIVGDLVADDRARVQDARDMITTTLAQAVHRVGLPAIDYGGAHTESHAQHIGLPTGLLDFTRSPSFAAYFAAADVTKSGLAGGRLVVYAVSETYVTAMNGETAQIGGLGNPNIVAQQGRMIRVKSDPPDLLAGMARRKGTIGEPFVPADKADARDTDNHLAAITLAQEHAGALLCALQKQGVDALSLYPGPSGLAEVVREVARLVALGHV